MSARAAVRHEIEKSHSLNRSNELHPDPPLRRGSVGLGSINPVLVSRRRADKETWGNVGKPSKFIQFFSWSAGNLERKVEFDTLNDVIASQYHISCIQEAR